MRPENRPAAASQFFPHCDITQCPAFVAQLLLRKSKRPSFLPSFLPSSPRSRLDLQSEQFLFFEVVPEGTGANFLAGRKTI